jgi:3-hydroxyacyl-CoA dehydrogenase / enoyl-CoA hydratase / 3-hydroxybutyryl-CoA epimerase
VVLVDRDMEAAEKGKAYSHKLMSDQVMKGRAKSADRDALLDRITPAADYAALAGCDLVIEAVFEDPAIKADVIAKVEAVVGPECIFGSNTSTLPISGLAKSASRPESFIGIHFFSPVEKMMLVEVIMGKQTGDKALAVALDYVRAIKKTPIVVNDARGFFANRCVGAYILEGHKMLAEGVPPAMIENAGKACGMPVGPLSLNDEVGLDLALRIVKATKAQIGEAAIDPAQEALLTRLVEKEGRQGRKNRKGFYDYPEGGKKSLWPGLGDLQQTKLLGEAVDFGELQQRLLVVQAIEAARTVEEGVITDPREADVGSILGFGFAPFTGGALSYIDFMGASAFVALCRKLEITHGPRFAPPQIVIDMTQNGGSFYARAGKAA